MVDMTYPDSDHYAADLFGPPTARDLSHMKTAARAGEAACARAYQAGLDDAAGARTVAPGLAYRRRPADSHHLIALLVILWVVVIAAAVTPALGILAAVVSVGCCVLVIVARHLRRHPVELALAVAGAVWLIARRRRRP